MFELPDSFSDRHRAAILKYLVSGRVYLTAKEWRDALTGFNVLHRAIITRGNERLSFATIYDLHIDREYAEPYIEEILALPNPTQYQPIRARFSRQIMQKLRTTGLRSSDAPGSNLLVAYCLYFWESFAAGYAFEIEIFRDLHQSGIHFNAHDIRKRESRMSSYDLDVLELHGDIKTSLYFLHINQGKGLSHDFYITRIYEGKAQRTFVVMLQLNAWEQIDGDTIEGLLKEATDHFPKPVQVELNQGSVVIAEYAVWKQKVLMRQQNLEE